MYYLHVQQIHCWLMTLVLYHAYVLCLLCSVYLCVWGWHVWVWYVCGCGMCGCGMCVWVACVGVYHVSLLVMVLVLCFFFPVINFPFDRMTTNLTP